MKRYSDSVADNTLLVSQNVTNLMNDIRAEDLLNDAVYYIDARDASASGQTIDNLGTAKELLPTTLGSSTSADSNDPKFLDHTGTNYVYLPGVAGNNMTVPDAAALDITGDIDVRVYLAADDWTPSATSYLLSKWQASPQYSWRFGLLTTGVLTFVWVTDGTTGTVKFHDSTVVVPFADGQAGWVRATLDVDNGASGADVKFFTSTDGTNWTQLGTTRTGAGTTSIFSGTSQVEIGSQAGASNLAGKVLRSQIFNGIDGTKVLDVDTSVLKTGAETSFTVLTGQTVTINRSTSGRKTVAVTQPCWLFGTDDYMEVNNRYMSSGTYLYLPGVASNNATAPDSAALDITGDIDARVKVAMDDWTPSAQSGFMSKWTSTGNQRSWRFSVISNGSLQAEWSADGISSTIIHTSSAVAGISDGTTKWVRWTLDVDNGASGYDSKFWTSDDGTNWTQLGTTQTGVATTSIFASTAILEIGTSSTGGTHSRGKFFRAQVFNGIDGTKVFDADFENKITSLEQASFVERSTNAATVTINRSGSTYRSAGITQAGYLYPGATNAFSASATDFLNFEANQSATLLVALRQWTTPVSYGMFIEKRTSGTTNGYSFSNAASNFYPEVTIDDGPNSVTTGAVTTGLSTSGGLTLYLININRTNQTLSFGINLFTSPTVNISSIGDISTVFPFAIGRRTFSTNLYNDMEFVSAAVFRRVLTSSEITLITNYFNRRSL